MSLFVLLLGEAVIFVIHNNIIKRRKFFTLKSNYHFLITIFILWLLCLLFIMYNVIVERNIYKYVSICPYIYYCTHNDKVLTSLEYNIYKFVSLGFYLS